MSTDYWAPPVSAVAPAQAVRPGLWRRDLIAFAGIVIACVFLGAPAGLLWSALSPHYEVRYVGGKPQFNDIESTKAFIGADGSYLLVMLGFGLACGGLAWVLARRFGPATVAGLLVGGVLAGLIAASVGVRPGAERSFAQLADKSRTSGSVQLYLGLRDKNDDLNLRAPWAVVGWPVAAISVVLVLGLWKPEEFD